VQEDDLATRVVEHFETAYDDPTVRLEEPYDGDGGRGVLDVYARARTPLPEDFLVELKADAAVRHATGANEIIRQLRRTERYFYDEEHAIRPKLSREGTGVHLLLLFAPTPTCVRHVADNDALYGSIDGTGRVNGVPAERKVAFLTGLDGDPGTLGFLSVNGGVTVGDAAFAEAAPSDSRLSAVLDRMEDLSS